MKGSFEKSAIWRKRDRSWTQKVEKAKHGLASYITPYVLTCDVNTGAPKPSVLPNPPNGGFM